ncbi:14138_t:CDS:2, partial [Dentiscutata heterogama]
MVTANDTQKESNRNSSILLDIITVKPITLSSNYGKNIPIDTKNSARKRCLTEYEKTNMLTNKELETSQIVLNRVLAQNQDQEILLNDPIKVLKEVQAHFQKQFISKKNSYMEAEKLWSDEYQPKRRIQESWFDP